MNKRREVGIKLSVICISFLILATGCKKDDNNDPADLTEIDGNIYHTVTIGTQVWMVENLMTTRFNDGTDINLVTGNESWENNSSSGYSWYDNDITNKTPYGALYNWFTAQRSNLCPTGWHVPTDTEWSTLEDYLGGTAVAGGKLKEAGITHWIDPNADGTNECGFTALPGGSRHIDGTFDGMGETAFWWTSTVYNTYYAWYRYVYYSNSYVSRYNWDARNGFSVRCVKN